MDYEIRKFKEGLVEKINAGRIPIEVKRMCVQEILIELNHVSEQVIAEQKKQSEVNEDGDTGEKR